MPLKFIFISESATQQESILNINNRKNSSLSHYTASREVWYTVWFSKISPNPSDISLMDPSPGWSLAVFTWQHSDLPKLHTGLSIVLEPWWYFCAYGFTKNSHGWVSLPLQQVSLLYSQSALYHLTYRKKKSCIQPPMLFEPIKAWGINATKISNLHHGSLNFT